MKRQSFLLVLGIVGCCIWPSLNSSAFPAISPGKNHPHTSSSILWEEDGIKDGTSGHNHLQARGHGSAVNLNEQPTDASHCWDDKISRYVNSGTSGNETGHCYISGKRSIDNRAPTYSFDGSGWTSQTENLVIDAIDEWTSVIWFGKDVGIAMFLPGYGETADISIVWDDTIADAAYNPQSKVMRFPHGPNFNKWNFSKSKSGIPDDEWHFYSFALHEVGHAFGFEHTIEASSVMNVYGNNLGHPKNLGGVHVDQLSVKDKQGAAALYGQPFPTCSAVSEFHYCANHTAVWTITATLPGFEVTNADYDVQINGSGGWIDIYEGPLTCPSVNLDNVFAIGRALLETEFGTSECTVYVPNWNCPGPGGGF